MDKFERHLAKPVTFEVENEVGEKDVFTIKVMPYEFMPEFFRAMKTITKIVGLDMKEGLSDKEEMESTKKLLDTLSEEDLKNIRLIVSESLKFSYPELKKEKRDRFAIANMFEILNATVEANSYGKRAQAKSRDTPKVK